MTGSADEGSHGGWVVDPWQRHPFRWFDGRDWSALVFDGTTQSLDPFVTTIRPAPPTIGGTATPSPTGATVIRAASDRSGRTPESSATPPVGGSAALGGSVQAGSGSDQGERPARPTWITALALVFVIGFAWWLYHLRDGDGLSVPGDAVDATASVSDAVGTSSSTIAALPLAGVPAPSSTAIVASSPVPSADASMTSTELRDCIEFIPIAAFIQDPRAQELWAAAGSDAAGLPAVCSAQTRERLAEIAQQRDDHEMYTTGSTSPSPSTEPSAPIESIAPPTVAVDDSTVTVSPTMPPPLPTPAP